MNFMVGNFKFRKFLLKLNVFQSGKFAPQEKNPLYGMYFAIYHFYHYSKVGSLLIHNILNYTFIITAG